MRADLPPHIRAFFQASVYPHPAAHIEMIQTHASWVFLSGKFAYKFKKPVNFGFMDFSSLEKRHHYCQRELRLNRCFAAEIYLEVLPVYQSGKHISLHMPSGKCGEVVDYCLKMLRFEQSCLLEQQLAKHLFKPLWMDQLATEVQRVHQRAQVDTRIEHGQLLADHIRDNLSIAEQHTGSATEPQCLQSLQQFAAATLRNKAALLQQRQQQGFIRHCHGDMHFRNIVLLHGKPVLFDCIEFNDAYSTIDCMNDIAFLLMDCDAHKRPDLGMRFLSRYLELSGDYSGLALLPLYLFYRAGVRGKVACILAGELEAGTKQQQTWQEARHYFTLAEHYTHSTTATLFAIGGLSGSGKSHLALLGCAQARAIVIRSDATRQRIASKHPEIALYSREMHIHTYRAMFDAARIALQAGYPVILDATFLHPDSRRQAQQLAGECGVQLIFYWLNIATEQLKANIHQRQQDNNDISDADLRVLQLQLRGYQRPSDPWIVHLQDNHIWPG